MAADGAGGAVRRAADLPPLEGAWGLELGGAARGAARAPARLGPALAPTAGGTRAPAWPPVSAGAPAMAARPPA